MSKNRMKPGAHSAPISTEGAVLEDAPRFTGPLAEKELLTVREFCAAVGMGATRAYELINRREVETVRIGQSRRITRRSIEAWLARLPRETPKSAL